MWRHSVTSRKLPCVAPIVLMTLFTGREGQASRVTTSRSSSKTQASIKTYFGKINDHCLFRRTPLLEIKMTLV